MSFVILQPGDDIHKVDAIGPFPTIEQANAWAAREKPGVMQIVPIWTPVGVPEFEPRGGECRCNPDIASFCPRHGYYNAATGRCRLPATEPKRLPM